MNPLILLLNTGTRKVGTWVVETTQKNKTGHTLSIYIKLGMTAVLGVFGLGVAATLKALMASFTGTEWTNTLAGIIAVVFCIPFTLTLYTFLRHISGVTARREAVELQDQAAEAEAYIAQHAEFYSGLHRGSILHVMKGSPAFKALIEEWKRIYFKDQTLTRSQQQHLNDDLAFNYWLDQQLAEYYVIEPNHEGDEENFVLHIFTPAGRQDSEVAALAAPLKATAHFYDVQPMRTTDVRAGEVSLICYENVPVSELTKLTEVSSTKDFFSQYPALRDNPTRDIFRIPLASTSRGEVWELPLHHTLVVGRTGGGKGSVIQGLIRQLAPFVSQNLSELYLIDPKNAEGLGYQTTSIFRRVASDLDDISETLDDFYQMMNEAKVTATRRNVVSTDRPVRVLMIDEFPSLKTMTAFMKKADEDGVTNSDKLTVIAAQGRSLNHYLILASQFATADAIGPIRSNMANLISLSIESSYEVGWMLGQENLENGSVAHPIPMSNEANNYQYAGIANVLGEDQNVKLVRFAYTSDADIEALQEQYALTDEQSETVNEKDLVTSPTTPNFKPRPKFEE